MYEGGAPTVASDSWLLRDPRDPPVLLDVRVVLLVVAVTRVLGSETVDDTGDEPVDSTVDSGCRFLSTESSRGETGGGACSSAQTVSQLRCREVTDADAMPIGRKEEYDAGSLTSTIRAYPGLERVLTRGLRLKQSHRSPIVPRI